MILVKMCVSLRFRARRVLVLNHCSHMLIKLIDHSTYNLMNGKCVKIGHLISLQRSQLTLNHLGLPKNKVYQRCVSSLKMSFETLLKLYFYTKNTLYAILYALYKISIND